MSSITKVYLVSSLLCLAISSSNAMAATTTATATFPGLSSIQINEGETVSGLVDFMQPLAGIEQVSFTMNFTDDLWDSGEKISVYFPGPLGYLGISAINSGVSPRTSYTLTTTSWTQFINAITDGATDFNITMQTGNIKVDSMTFTAVTAVPLPPALYLLMSGIMGLGIARKRQTAC